MGRLLLLNVRKNIFSPLTVCLERKKNITFVCAKEQERERDCVCVGRYWSLEWVWVWAWIRERLCVSMCVCVSERERVCVCQRERESDGAVFVGWRCGEVTFNCLQSHITKPIFHPKAKNTSHSLSHSLPISLFLSHFLGASVSALNALSVFFSFTQKFGGDPIFVVYFHRV